MFGRLGKPADDTSAKPGGPVSGHVIKARKAPSARLRFISAAAPAALVTAGLYAVMTGLVKVDEVELAKGDQRILTPIVYTEVEKDPLKIKDRRPKAPDDVLTPPPPPQISNTSHTPGFPPITNIGHVPDGIPGGSIVPILTGPQPIGERVAIPVRPPMPTYPYKAAQRGISGECKVRFDITPQGTPFNVVASCSDSIFESEARRSVSRTEFLPQIRDGRPVESYGAVYPLIFSLNSE